MTARAFSLYAEPAEVGPFAVGLGERGDGQTAALVWLADGSGSAASAVLDSDGLDELIEALRGVREGFSS